MKEQDRGGRQALRAAAHAGWSIALASEAQRNLALWAYLKCSLFQNMERNAAVKDAWAKAYPVFYESQAAGMLPADHQRVFGSPRRRLCRSGSAPVARNALSTRRVHSDVHRRRAHAAGDPQLPRLLEVERDPKMANHDHRLSPLTGMFTWPSGEPLRDDELAVYTGPRAAGPTDSGLTGR